MPRANGTPSVPTTSTVSPSPKRPATSTTPAGSRLVWRSTSARRAPSSTVTDPATGEAKAIHSLRAASLRRWASKLVPTASSATAAPSTPGRAALAMTVRTPDHEAMRAASSLLAMPPLPRPLPPRPALIASIGSSTRDPRDELGVGVRRGGRPCTARRGR